MLCHLASDQNGSDITRDNFSNKTYCFDRVLLNVVLFIWSVLYYFCDLKHNILLAFCWMFFFVTRSIMFWYYSGKWFVSEYIPGHYIQFIVHLSSWTDICLLRPKSAGPVEQSWSSSRRRVNYKVSLSLQVHMALHDFYHTVKPLV